MIDLSPLEASRFIGTSSFSGRIGEVRYATFNGATIIELDSNGDRITDLQIELGGSVSLVISDFLGLEIDASGRGKKTVSTSAATSEQSSFDSGPPADPITPTSDIWLPTSDSLMIYA